MERFIKCSTVVFVFLICIFVLVFISDPNRFAKDINYSSAEIVSCRTYDRVSGTYLSTRSTEYVEYIFYQDGELKIERCPVRDIFIGETNLVGIQTSEFFVKYKLSLTLEDYQELTGEGFWEPAVE